MYQRGDVVRGKHALHLYRSLEPGKDVCTVELLTPGGRISVESVQYGLAEVVTSPLDFASYHQVKLDGDKLRQAYRVTAYGVWEHPRYRFSWYHTRVYRACPYCLDHIKTPDCVSDHEVFFCACGHTRVES